MAASATAQPLSGGSDDTVGDSAKFGVVTISDRASSGVYQDLSGPAILGFFSEAINSKLLMPADGKLSTGSFLTNSHSSSRL